MYSHVQTLLTVLGRRFEDKSKGATAVEYGIMVAGIAALIIATVFLIGPRLNVMFQGILTQLGGPVGS
ncbi:Flp family type IVb pilin [Tessaracoccus oleiagri]|uniref:Flp family type IVb pilin n=1 Tax=Tessaracoccus oleiagri TaxID=686624 RepID=UPI001C40B107|nr:Flp family type IVb pilin [Tessaracoccus oleiagri]